MYVYLHKLIYTIHIQVCIYFHVCICTYYVGGLGMWDLRMTKKKVSVLAGSSGSIRDLHMTPSGRLLYYVSVLILYNTLR
jgi:hypothetical protein